MFLKKIEIQDRIIHTRHEQREITYLESGDVNKEPYKQNRLSDGGQPNLSHHIGAQISYLKYRIS